MADADLERLVAEGRGDVPLRNLRFHCSNCRSGRYAGALWNSLSSIRVNMGETGATVNEHHVPWPENDRCLRQLVRCYGMCRAAAARPHGDGTSPAGKEPHGFPAG